MNSRLTSPLAPVVAEDPDPSAGSRPYLSVIVPMHDEEECIRPLYDRLTENLEALGRPYEIIAVDDGSRDRTFAVLVSIAESDDRLRVVRLRRNFGQTAALKAGFDRALGDVFVTIDADLQNDPADIPKLLAKLDQGYDIASGWRVRRKDPFLSRRLPSLIANRLISWTTGVHLNDFGCTLKAYRAEVVRGIDLYGELHRFVPAIVSWQGVSVAELPVSHSTRYAGRSKYGAGRTLRVIVDLITVRFLLSYSTRPMQVFGKVGMASIITGVAIDIYLAGLKLFSGAHLANRPLLLLGVLLIVIGVQLIGIGLTGELTVRMKGRVTEPYVVREEVHGGSGALDGSGETLT